MIDFYNFYVLPLRYFNIDKHELDQKEKSGDESGNGEYM